MRIFFAVIVTILLLVVFITFGLDEHVLCVVLHNIRVFMKRLYATIKKLKQKKSANDMEWEDGSVLNEPLMHYRSIKENKSTREEKLLNQLIILEQEKNLLQEKNEEITKEHEQSKVLLIKQINELENQLKKIQIENKEYKRVLSNLQIVDQNSVASPFCSEHEHILSLLNELVKQILVEYETLSSSASKITLPLLMNVLYSIGKRENSSIVDWYVMLRETSLIPKELTFDVTSKANNASILEYLQKYAFENYYRLCISTAILFAENVKIRINESKQRINLQNIINDFIQKLHINYGIEIDYVPINTILSDSEYSKYDIETISNGEEENKVLSVRKYAVNRSKVYAQPEKTILILNI